MFSLNLYGMQWVQAAAFAFAGFYACGWLAIRSRRRNLERFIRLRYQGFHIVRIQDVHAQIYPPSGPHDGFAVLHVVDLIGPDDCKTVQLWTDSNGTVHEMAWLTAVTPR